MHLIRKATTGTKPSLSRLVKAQPPPPPIHPLTKSEVQSLLVTVSPTATSELRTHDIVRMPTPTFGGLHPTDYLMFHIWEKFSQFQPILFITKFSLTYNPIFFLQSILFLIMSYKSSCLKRLCISLFLILKYNWSVVLQPCLYFLFNKD